VPDRRARCSSSSSRLRKRPSPPSAANRADKLRRGCVAARVHFFYRAQRPSARSARRSLRRGPVRRCRGRRTHLSRL
jgi:hypothetical protein